MDMSQPGFVKTYSLPLDELLIPDIQHGYKNFNDFFSRRLKEGARPPAEPENPRVMVSPADCRAVVFQSVSEAQKIWIKVCLHYHHASIIVQRNVLRSDVIWEIRWKC